MKTRSFDFTSTLQEFPEIPEDKQKSGAILAIYRRVFYIGHLNVNGTFYLFNNVGGIKIISTKEAKQQPDAIEWVYLKRE